MNVLAGPVGDERHSPDRASDWPARGSWAGRERSRSCRRRSRDESAPVTVAAHLRRLGMVRLGRMAGLGFLALFGGGLGRCLLCFCRLVMVGRASRFVVVGGDEEGRTGEILRTGGDSGEAARQEKRGRKSQAGTAEIVSGNILFGARRRDGGMKPAIGAKFRLETGRQPFLRLKALRSSPRRGSRPAAPASRAVARRHPFAVAAQFRQFEAQWRAVPVAHLVDGADHIRVGDAAT